MQSKDLLIHNKIHEDYINQDPSTIFSHRVNVLKYFKNKYYKNWNNGRGKTN